MNRSIETNSNLSLILVDERPDRFIQKKIFSNCLDSLDDAVEIDDYPFNDSCDFSNIKLSSSCNGLVAVKTRPRSREIALWNPSTKKHRILPKCCDDDIVSVKCANGFGYDAASDDYKLVRILQSGDDEFTGDSVYVYSLRTNSWRQIKELPFPFFDAHGGGAFVSGALLWLACTTPEVAKYDLMVAFDLNSEEFYQVPLPLVEDDGYFDVVEDFRGCLCLTRDYDMYEDDYRGSFSI